MGQTVEVWDDGEDDWYSATIEKFKDKQYFVYYVGYGSFQDEWVDEENVRFREHTSSDENGYAVGQKVKVWDEDSGGLVFCNYWQNPRSAILCAVYWL